MWLSGWILRPMRLRSRCRTRIGRTRAPRSCGGRQRRRREWRESAERPIRAHPLHPGQGSVRPGQRDPVEPPARL